MVLGGREALMLFLLFKMLFVPRLLSTHTYVIRSECEPDHLGIWYSSLDHNWRCSIGTLGCPNQTMLL